MGTSRLNWKLIDEAAKELGVGFETRKSWRHRGSVPHKWRYPIVEYLGGEISMRDFETESSSERSE